MISLSNEISFAFDVSSHDKFTLADQRENDAVEQPSATAKRNNTGTLFDHFAKKSKNYSVNTNR
jgi:hypothetical protein